MTLPARNPSSLARRSLAATFDLPYSDDMQDWEWEVADATRFEEFLDVFRTGDLSDDERFSLMEVLVQCAEDVANAPEFEVFWQSIKHSSGYGLSFKVQRSSIGRAMKRPRSDGSRFLRECASFCVKFSFENHLRLLSGDEYVVVFRDEMKSRYLKGARGGTSSQ